MVHRLTANSPTAKAENQPSSLDWPLTMSDWMTLRSLLKFGTGSKLQFIPKSGAVFFIDTNLITAAYRGSKVIISHVVEFHCCLTSRTGRLGPSKISTEHVSPVWVPAHRRVSTPLSSLHLSFLLGSARFLQCCCWTADPGLVLKSTPEK